MTRTAWCAKCDGPVPTDKRGCIACHEEREADRQRRTNAPIGKFCAQCTGDLGLHRAQLEPCGPVYTLCATCDRDQAPRPVSSIAKARDWGRRRTNGYAPIDDLLENIRFRILRAIRHFDWVSPDRLVDALDVPSWDLDRHRRGNFDTALSRLCRNGLLERIGVPMSYEYRITDLGRAEYEMQLARSAA